MVTPKEQQQRQQQESSIRAATATRMAGVINIKLLIMPLMVGNFTDFLTELTLPSGNDRFGGVTGT